MDNQLGSLFTTGLSLCLYIYIFLFLPGYLLVSNIKLLKLEKILVSLVFSFSFYSFLVYFFRHLGLPFLVVELFLLIVLLVNFYYQQNLLKKFTIFKVPKIRITLLIFLFISIVIATIHSAVSNRSGWYLKDGSLSFTELSYHDSMQHLSFIKRSYETNDITHPGFSGAQLKNYHYLIDTSLAAITRFTFIDLFHTYYRFYPIGISLIISLSIFAFTRRLTNNEWLSNLAVIFTIFAGNASFFISYFRGNEFTWSANAFLINPIIDILQNPASIFVLAQMLTVFLLVDNLSKVSRVNRHLLFKTIFLITIIAGTMIGFKAWGGLLMNGSLLVMGLWDLIKNKRPFLFLTFLFTLILSLSLFLPGYDKHSAASPIWAPGWSLRRMLNDADRWNNISEIYQEETFIFQNRPLHLLKLYTKWVLIYWFGNYWIRVIGFISIIGLVFKNIKLKALEIGIISITIVSFVMPLLFNQGRMAYDIEQFSPYAVVLSSIFTIYFFFWITKRFTYSQSLTTALIYIVMIWLVLISWPSNLTSLSARISAKERIITSSEVDLYKYIETKTDFNNLFLIYPSHRNVATLEFAALTGRDTVYSGRTLSVITGEDFETRYNLVLNTMQNSDSSKQDQLYKDFGVDYLLLLNEDMARTKLNYQQLEIVFENEAGAVYKVK